MCWSIEGRHTSTIATLEEERAPRRSGSLHGVLRRAIPLEAHLAQCRWDAENVECGACVASRIERHRKLNRAGARAARHRSRDTSRHKRKAARRAPLRSMGDLPRCEEVACHGFSCVAVHLKEMVLAILGICAILLPLFLVPLLIADHWIYTSSLPVINTSRVRVRVAPPLEPYRPQDCEWAAPSAKAFNSGSPRIAVCLAGAFRTITSPQVHTNIARFIESMSSNTHIFAVGQLGDEKGTGPHVLGQKSRLSENALRPAWQRLQPVCVRYDEQPPPCQESSCTGQWHKWSSCARLAEAFAQRRGSNTICSSSFVST